MAKRLLLSALFLFTCINYAQSQEVITEDYFDSNLPQPMTMQPTGGDFRGYLEAGAGYVNTGFAANLFCSYGYKFEGLFYLGGGTGVYYGDIDKTLSVPLYINPRLYFTQKWSDPFIDLKVGYSFDLSNYNSDIDTRINTSGLYLNPAIGFEEGIHGRFYTFTLSIPMQFGKSTTSESHFKEWKNQLFWGAMFTVGIRF